MIIKSKNFDLKIEEILKDDLPKQSFNRNERLVIDLVKSWHSAQEYYTHQTSGSTGSPKKITISRKKIVLSARATQQFIDPKLTIQSSLLCLDPHYIGGAMVVYRSLIFGHNLTITTPSSDPLEYIGDSQSFDIVSIAPLQFNNMNKTDIERFGIILIGGAPMPVMKNDTKTKIYSTFGMTETVSHIALREIHEQTFKTTGDTVVGVDNDRALKIKGSITDHEWLETQDIVELENAKSFKWIGRKDFIINSGGIKINPEEIEELLETQISGAFMIGSLPDSELGRKVVLIAECGKIALDFSMLPKYHKPKVQYFNQTIFQTNSGKLDRLKTQQYFEKNI